MRLKPLARIIPTALVASGSALNPVFAGAAEQQLDAVDVFASKGAWQAGSIGAGTFRDTPAKEVPMTVNVVDRDLLDAQQANSLYEALKNTAGVARAQLGATVYDNLSIRGLLVENRSNYRLNGGLPVVNLIDLPLENKERVEVLKGVGGLYYGFVPPSGIINLVTKRAGKVPVTAVQLSTDDNGTLVAGADIGRRFGEQGQFGARINAVGGELKSAVDGADGDRQLFAGAFDWQVSDRWLLKLDHEEIAKDVVEQSSIKTLAAVNGRVPLPRIPDPRKLIAPSWANYDARAHNTQIRSDVALSDTWVWTLEAGRAYLTRDRNFSQMESYNLATGEGTLRISRIKGQSYENRNARTEVAGRIGLGGVQHDLTIGYAQNTLDQTGGATRVQTVSQNLYNPRAIAPIAVTYPTPQAHVETMEKGTYVFDRVDFGSWLLMAGARASKFNYDHPTQKYSVDKVTPTLATVFRMTSALNLYAGYLEGLEDGGAAPLGTANQFEPQAPIVSRQVEAGIKGDWAGMQANAAAFQIERPMNGVNPVDNRFGRLGEGRYRGIEVSAGGPLAARWMVAASAQWLDAEFTSAENDAQLIGKRPANTPKVTGSLFVEHRLAALPELAVSAGAFYTGARAVDPLNQAFVAGYTRYDLGTRWRARIADQQLDVAANVENVTDKRYWAAAGDSRVNSNSPLLAVGMPRTLRVSAKVSF